MIPFIARMVRCHLCGGETQAFRVRGTPFVFGNINAMLDHGLCPGCRFIGQVVPGRA